MLTSFFIIVLILVALFAAAWAHADGSPWWYLVALVALVTAMAALSADTNDKEQACRDRGGEVVNYGRYGTGVNCINVPK